MVTCRKNNIQELQIEVSGSQACERIKWAIRHPKVQLHWIMVKHNPWVAVEFWKQEKEICFWSPARDKVLVNICVTKVIRTNVKVFVSSDQRLQNYSGKDGIDTHILLCMTFILNSFNQKKSLVDLSDFTFLYVFLCSAITFVLCPIYCLWYMSRFSNITPNFCQG